MNSIVCFRIFCSTLALLFRNPTLMRWYFFFTITNRILLDIYFFFWPNFQFCAFEIHKQSYEWQKKQEIDIFLCTKKKKSIDKNNTLRIKWSLNGHTFSSETSRDFKLLPTTRSSSSSSTILLLGKKGWKKKRKLIILKKLLATIPCECHGNKDKK